MINIALPKGRLGNKAYKLLEACGYTISELMDESRKLVFRNEESGVQYFLVKPTDVPVYVSYGVADLGVVGKDVLIESDADVYSLMDLGIGKCRMCVAAKEDYVEDKSRPIIVATKFPNIAREYYAKEDREIEVIKLYGSIELAPILGMSDVIVDIVETGTTLKENAIIKATTIMKITGLPTLADDTGLMVDALNGEPGVYSARYAGEQHDDKANVAKLLKNLEPYKGKERSAHFVTCMVIAYPNGEIKSVEGRTDGEITTSPSGKNGFGYDPVFYSYDLKKVFAEATPEEKNSVSHRGRALAKIIPLIK